MTAKDLQQLERLLPERVGLIDSPIWDAGRQVFSPIGRLRKPTAVVRPADRQDVLKVMQWANDTNTRVLPRSGGHSFDAFSIQDETVMLDLRDLNQVSLGDGVLNLMPKATNFSVNQALAHVDRILPGGDCPTVAMGGQLSGGGFGYVGKLFGLTLDSLLEATVVTGDGAIVTASPDENSDLFWACRGGGGCGGIMTDMVCALHEVQHVTCIQLDFQWEAAADVLMIYADMMRNGPAELDLKLKIRTTGTGRFYDKSCDDLGYGGKPLVHLDGLHLGGRKQIETYLLPLTSHPGLIESTVVEKDTYHDAMKELIPFELLRDPAPKDITPIRVASDFSRGGLEADEVDAVVRFIDTLEYAPEYAGGCVLLEPCNGRIANPEPEDTAFPHRDAELLLQWEMFHDVGDGMEVRQRQDELLNGVRSELARILTGGRYLNYADRLDRPSQWWGDNLDRLKTVAARFDPNRRVISRLWPTGQLETAHS